MLGLFGTLNLAARSLQAQQTGVEVTGQNLANANNPAYARQRVNFQTSIAISTPLGPEGTGVQVAAIQQIRNSLLDGQIRDETSVGGFWQTAQSALQNTQTQLGEFLDSSTGVAGTSSTGSTTGVQGLSAQLAGLFNAFGAVAANPASLPDRQALVNQATTLAGSFNQISARLSTVNQNLNESVANDVQNSNKLLSDIASLNDEITRTEASTGGSANDLRDQREQKLESLAQLGNFQVSTASDGTLSVSVNGNVLVAGGKSLDTLQTFDAGGGQLLVRLAGSGTTATFTGGSLAGEINVRDGSLADLRTGLDSLASNLISQVNSVYSTGYDLNGNTGATFFSGTTAATMGVNAALQGDPSLVQAAASGGGSSDNTIARAIAQLATQPVASLGNKTFSDAYGQLVMNQGNALANANNQVANYTSVSQLLSNQRDSVSGVSMEEEMTNLMTFQKAYQASAQVMSTVNQMLVTLVGIKTV